MIKLILMIIAFFLYAAFVTWHEEETAKEIRELRKRIKDYDDYIKS